jgi:hypothetical protein
VGDEKGFFLIQVLEDDGVRKCHWRPARGNCLSSGSPSVCSRRALGDSTKSLHSLQSKVTNKKFTTKLKSINAQHYAWALIQFTEMFNVGGPNRKRGNWPINLSRSCAPFPSRDKGTRTLRTAETGRDIERLLRVGNLRNLSLGAQTGNSRNRFVDLEFVWNNRCKK